MSRSQWIVHNYAKLQIQHLCGSYFTANRHGAAGTGFELIICLGTYILYQTRFMLET